MNQLGYGPSTADIGIQAQSPQDQMDSSDSDNSADEGCYSAFGNTDPELEYNISLASSD